MSAEDALDAWQGHNRRLSLSASISIVAAIALIAAARAPDALDPWYLAIAIEFAAWGAINLAFAASGSRGIHSIRSLDPEPRVETALHKARDMLRLLKFNTWLNVLWLTTGAVLLVTGYWVWSSSLVGHGVGVLAQAIGLTLLDLRFVRELRRATV